MDVCGNIDPFEKIGNSDLKLSVLSTELSYKVDDKKGSFTSLDNNHLYDSITECSDIGPALSEDYCDKFEEVSATLYSTLHFNECEDITTTYLGYVDPNSKKIAFNHINEISIKSNCISEGCLTTGTNFKILFDTGASRSYLSKDFYLANSNLHSLPKFAATCKGIIVGNGERVSILFIIPIIVTIQGHQFEIFTTIIEMHDGIDMVFGMQNMIETEGEMSARDGCYRFISRSIPIFPQNTLTVEPKGKVYMKLKTPFCEKLSGRGLAKLFCHPRVDAVMLRLIHNQGLVEFQNNSPNPALFNPKTPVGVLDLRSLGYFKVTYKDLVARFSGTFMMYHYSKETVSQEPAFNHMVPPTRSCHKPRPNHHKSQPSCDPYPWLESDNPRRHMNDRDILYDRIDLSDSCLTPKEKGKLMSLIMKYKQAFSLRDEIGHCPNLKADIKIIEDSSFFVRPFPISEADKPFMDRQMERLVSLGILTRRSTSHTSPVMLITRKLTKDKQPVVDFRLLNTRILRRNTSIPLMADVLNILGNSRCECLTCCDLKDAYHSIPLSEESKEYCGILPYFGSPIYRYEVLPMGISCAPQIWMDYITLILNDLDQKSKFIAIMDDLLIHSAKQEHWTLVELLLGTMIKNGLKLSPKKCHFFKTKLTYMGNQFRITNKTMTITPLHSRTEAIQQIPTPNPKTM